MGKFKSKEELGGEIDPRINVKGNPDFGKKRYIPEKPTNRYLRERELMGLLRKLKPHVAEAIMAAVNIMKNKEAAHANQLKAATILLDQYKQTMKEVYDKDYDEEEAEEVQQQQTPLFSLKLVNDVPFQPDPEIGES
jgi:hypothetical protein